MCAFADKLLGIPRLDSEGDLIALNLCDFGMGADCLTKGGCDYMFDGNECADGSLMLRDEVLDGVNGGNFHQGDEGRGSINRYATAAKGYGGERVGNGDSLFTDEANSNGHIRLLIW